MLNGTIGYFIGLFVVIEHRHRKQFKMHQNIPIHTKNYNVLKKSSYLEINFNLNNAYDVQSTLSMCSPAIACYLPLSIPCHAKS